MPVQRLHVTLPPRIASPARTRCVRYSCRLGLFSRNRLDAKGDTVIDRKGTGGEGNGDPGKEALEPRVTQRSTEATHGLGAVDLFLDIPFGKDVDSNP